MAKPFVLTALRTTTGDGKIMEYKKLDRKAISSWRLKRLLSLVVILLICGGASLAAGVVPAMGAYRFVVWGVLGTFVLYKLMGLILYPLIEYKQWRYAISEDKVDIRHGIFFVTNTVIPIIRIQHITIDQGPINRRFGLYNVEISLASDSFEIECLSHQVASEIVENLTNKLYTRLEEREEDKA